MQCCSAIASAESGELYKDHQTYHIGNIDISIHGMTVFCFHVKRRMIRVVSWSWIVSWIMVNLTTTLFVLCCAWAVEPESLWEKLSSKADSFVRGARSITGIMPKQI